ncbi:hypothetical protein EVAR_76807_1 [Eumeta japonica]|uniref:Uncharacterized protein n=1 Tax=Eumeta variegata TaxID=151549 RepID=A0A4C1ST36_EUMVA|nr:hypothetical protein EVAR_76807_1 [Eumeta japonica]
MPRTGGSIRYRREPVYRAHLALIRQISKVHGHAPSNVISGCSAVAIGHLRSSPLDHPFSLVYYCASVFLRAAFRSVGLRVCMSVCGAAQCTSHCDSYATSALVPVIYSGYSTVCTPSPCTVSAPREHSRRLTLQMPIAILVISRVLHE